MGGSRTVMIFGTFDASRHPRVAVLEEGLRAAGEDVRRCNVPWDASTAARVRSLRDPVTAVRLAVRLLRAWWELAARARRIDIEPDIVLVGYLGVLDVHLARRCWPAATIVLDHLAPVGGTVDDRLDRGGLRARVARWIDARARAAADLVVVDTEQHRRAPADVVVPVGASGAWFEARRLEHRQPGPLRIVFFGLYTPLHGATTVARALRLVAADGIEIEATLIGEGQDRPAAEKILAGTPGVRWLDWVEPDELPAMVAAHDICLGIFGTSAKATRVVPNKVFQGAAAGCAIVTAETVPQRRALADGARYVRAGDADGLAAILTELDRDRLALSAARAAAALHAQQRFGADAVVQALLEALDSAGGSSGGIDSPSR